MDFTLRKYKLLLEALHNQNYLFQTFEDFVTRPANRVVILRHDVDLRPENALQLAQIENEFGVRSSYYFRAIPESSDENIIKMIIKLGHEIGYHYETLPAISKTKKFDDYSELIDEGFIEFKKNLEYFRSFYNVKTVCMHGSPLSKYDSKDMWKKHNYKSLGIIADFYFDVDYSSVLYLTDTGRRWDGEKFSVRDKSSINKKNNYKMIQNLTYQHRYKKTDEIINTILCNKFYSRVIINTHPQRWNNNTGLWIQELIYQNVKNIGKYFIVRLRN